MGSKSEPLKTVLFSGKYFPNRDILPPKLLEICYEGLIQDRSHRTQVTQNEGVVRINT